MLKQRSANICESICAVNTRRLLKIEAINGCSSCLAMVGSTQNRKIDILFFDNFSTINAR